MRGRCRRVVRLPENETNPLFTVDVQLLLLVLVKDPEELTHFSIQCNLICTSTSLGLQH